MIDRRDFLIGGGKAAVVAGAVAVVHQHASQPRLEYHIRPYQDAIDVLDATTGERLTVITGLEEAQAGGREAAIRAQHDKLSRAMAALA